MPRGGARLGAGRPRMPLTQHVLRGTWRKDRHGELPAHVHAIDAEGGSDAWMPAEAQLQALGEAGRAFLERMLSANDVTAVEGELLLELGHCTQALADVRAIPREGLTLKEANALGRLEQGWVQRFSSLMQMVRTTA